MNITFGETSARRSHAVGRADGDCEAMVLRGCTGYIVDVTVYGCTWVMRIDRVSGWGVEFTHCNADGKPSTSRFTSTWDDIESIHIN